MYELLRGEGRVQLDTDSGVTRCVLAMNASAPLDAIVCPEGTVKVDPRAF
jgi:hypothetical protein